MIFGDPNIFAIYADKVDAWSDDSFDNGHFHFILSGRFLPPASTNSTLSVDFSDMVNIPARKLWSVSDDVFSKNTQELYSYMYDLRYPDFDSGKSEDYSYSIASTTLLDARCNVFIISNGKLDRIIYSRGCGEFEIGEIVLETGYFEKVIELVSQYFHKVYKKRSSSLNLAP